MANDVEYGLCASVWSENVGKIHRVSSELGECIMIFLSVRGRF